MTALDVLHTDDGSGSHNAQTHHHNNVTSASPGGGIVNSTSAATSSDIFQEIWLSSELLFSNKITWLLVLGPVALFGDAYEIVPDALCFAFSGIALIPCAERLSFVTEQVAEHTNGTIGALLNATFGNAPELLIATAALRSGLYRVVQLAMLGSMLTNLLFVFGISCLIGGFRWQVQEIRMVSGNVSVGLLLLAVAGSLLPAALILSGQLNIEHPVDEGVASKEELQLSRINALVMIFMYACYLTFQLGTHKEEFDEDGSESKNNDANPLSISEQHQHHGGGGNKKARKNLFCMSVYSRMTGTEYSPASISSGMGDVEMAPRDQLPLLKQHSSNHGHHGDDDHSSVSDSSGSEGGGNKLLPQNETVRDNYANGYFDEYEQHEGDSFSARRRRSPKEDTLLPGSTPRKKPRDYPPGRMLPLGLADPSEIPPPPPPTPPRQEPIMSFRVGIVWLFIITLCISAMSDILVDTIEGFSKKLDISEVFLSMVILPYFSNVAEQVSAIIFAYRNEMDLCVGVTVGSAIQVATFVLPGCVLIGFFVDRAMTLYLHAYETVCLLLAVIVVAAVLQGGTTNWLVGATLVSIYVMIATGFWFHEIENLTVDAEIAAHGGHGR